MKATIAPNVSVALQILHAANLYEKTFGVLTFCDELGRKHARKLEPWVRNPGDGQGALKLEPWAGWQPLMRRRRMSREMQWCMKTTTRDCGHRPLRS